jgi:hypothetical protein
MRHDVDTALAFYSVGNTAVADVEVDDETDLLAGEEQELCPDCGTELVGFEEDPLTLHCPVCVLSYR